MTNLEDFFGGGITLAQYERTDDPMVQSKQRQAEAMNIDLIDMNAFVMDDEPVEEGGVLPTRGSDGSDTN